MSPGMPSAWDRSVGPTKRTSTPSTASDSLHLVQGGLGFDLHDGEQLLVTPCGALVTGAPEVHAAREQRDAALPGRLRPQPADDPMGLIGRVHLRDHDAGRSQVQGAADSDALACLDAHQRRGRGESGSHEQGQEVRLTGGAVLEVDEHPVEARPTGDLDEERGRPEDERAEEGLPGQDSAAQRSRRIRSLQRAVAATPRGICYSVDWHGPLAQR